MKKRTGFTLIELMIVVAIIAIIAAIAVPNLLRSRMQSNESAAIGNLRTVLGAEVTYHGGNYEYAIAWDTLTDAEPTYLKGTWTDDTVKNGYKFVLGGAVTNFTCIGRPDVVDTTGSKSFFVDASGVITYVDGDADPTADDTAIGEQAAAGE